jgi:cyclohexyl-isocyanide hydratase
MEASTQPGHLKIGALIFPKMDQCDFTGPFEALSRIPASSFYTIWKDLEPVADMRGMRILPDTTMAEAPELDVLLVPGGYGQHDLMGDEEVLAFIRKQWGGCRYLFSVCTGALLCGAAGLLSGKRATTHWASLDLLPFYGAAAVDERVVVDGKLVSAAGVTAGIDGSLLLVSLLRGRQAAEALQLYMAYDPQPPFDAGSPRSAPPSILAQVREAAAPMTAMRLAAARNYEAASTRPVGTVVAG